MCRSVQRLPRERSLIVLAFSQSVHILLRPLSWAMLSPAYDRNYLKDYKRGGLGKSSKQDPEKGCAAMTIAQPVGGKTRIRST